MSTSNCFDVIVIGGGHAGCEAAMACSKVGLKTLLLTGSIDKIGHLSCNPAIGGIGKGHMVKEIGALGGQIASWADASAIQVRTLNASKGVAVRATRAQIDREVYMSIVKSSLYSQKNLHIREEIATELLQENNNCIGVKTAYQQSFFAKHIVITVGTFLRGRLHIGNNEKDGGRIGDSPSIDLAKSIEDLGFKMQRFMTCTTPRLLGSSIDFSQMEIQEGDSPTPYFWYKPPSKHLTKKSCYLTWTNLKTHEIINEYLNDSPMYNGKMPAKGPRYCPSIEDKVARFPDKLRHQVFIEPEGLNSGEFFPNGIPTGFPVDVQQKIIESIAGLENAKIVRPGYAVAYDIIDPKQLNSTLESKTINNLWFAGQVNGTSGYEEAAAQGLWAALNIIAKERNLPKILPNRSTSYISVLIDDLVTKGTDEPYRMFTSCAEHRLLLRESNACLRLTPLGREYGLVDDEQWEDYKLFEESIKELQLELKNNILTPTEKTRAKFLEMGEPPLSNSISVGDLLRRPSFDYAKLSIFHPNISNYSSKVLVEVEALFTYSGYITRQEELASNQLTRDNIIIPDTINYNNISGLDLEAREKFIKISPRTIGQAMRIPGISPAAISCLEIAIKKISY